MPEYDCLLDRQMMAGKSDLFEMMTRAQLDTIAWRSIHDRPAQQLTTRRGYRPHDYAEIEEQLHAGIDFETSWSNFLHAFYDYRLSTFFAQPSPRSLSPGWRAILAGAAEYLSGEFDLLAYPAWADDQQYFMKDVWDPLTDWLPEVMVTETAERLARAPEAFRRRNIAFEARNLIAL